MTSGDLHGRRFLVTGANSGIGRSTVEALVPLGASVVLASRSEERTRPVLDALRQRYRDADLLFLPLDLADLASVRRAADTFLESGQSLDVLINNAGLAGPRGVTKDGFEITVGTNHIGPFLLTSLLLPRVRESPQGRIVNVSSEAHRRLRRMPWESLARPSVGLHGYQAYSISKLMNILHAKEIARRVAAPALTTYALHPGVVASNIWRSVPWPVRTVIKLFMTSNEEGARTTMYCATDPSLSAVSGRYYNKSQEVDPSALAQDDAVARELYTRTEEAIASVGR